ncbi:hypothetical protein XpruCFBP8354_19690 [Xanthomonas prunicola]|uniref:Uncharacterized protein n=1 Tax=Xanthomonas prunicola TaxID=2053930 RepID=A0ABX4RFZ5_9XANT|nr:hypothetical protein XpruCFBP8354_19690 [Xanthomonas prunicola]
MLGAATGFRSCGHSTCCFSLKDSNWRLGLNRCPSGLMRSLHLCVRKKKRVDSDATIENFEQ